MTKFNKSISRNNMASTRAWRVPYWSPRTLNKYPSPNRLMLEYSYSETLWLVPRRTRSGGGGVRCTFTGIRRIGGLKWRSGSRAITGCNQCEWTRPCGGQSPYLPSGGVQVCFYNNTFKFGDTVKIGYQPPLYSYCDADTPLYSDTPLFLYLEVVGVTIGSTALPSSIFRNSSQRNPCYSGWSRMTIYFPR